MSPFHRTIWKYTLKPGMNRIPIRGEAHFISVGEQGDDIVAWALVGHHPDGSLLSEHRIFCVFTGGEIASHGPRFVGTVQRSDGIVVHVFQGTTEVIDSTRPRKGGDHG